MRNRLRMFGAILESWCWMIRYDLAPQRFSSRCLREFASVGSSSALNSATAVIRLEKAFNIAAAFYWKPIKCLQRSCCLVLLLARHGYQATIVIGVTNWPPASHAWCEYGSMLLGELESRVAPYKRLPPTKVLPACKKCRLQSGTEQGTMQ
jgi:hypothetical protein